jgi:tetratricopeptide (TPR) repeat protein
MEFTTTDYLLVIDADETLVGGVEPLRKAIKEHPDSPVFRLPTLSAKNKEGHISVRLHKNDPEKIFWKGACHNYLSIIGGPVLENVDIRYGYSPAHQLDPDRSFRILKKCCEDNPEAIRERYYLAREYYYRRDYGTALDHYKEYWKHSRFAMEKADSKLIAAKCAIALGNYEDAWKWLFDAIQINADFAEAYRVLATISGPKNSEHWKRIADSCTNQDVLFVRMPK